MSADDDERVLATVRAYRDALTTTQQLYQDAGRQITQQYAWLIENDPAAFTSQMDDLHRGLAMKVFGELAPSGTMDSLEHRQIGRVLLSHVWGKPVLGPELHDAVRWLINESANFRWEELVQPFAALPPLRDRWGELVSAVSRMANVVAKSDGQVGPAETLKLQQIQSELDRLRAAAPERFGSMADAQRISVERVARGSETLRGPPIAVQAAAPAPKAIEPKPISEPQLSPEERLATAIKKLDELIGLTTIKDQVRTLTNFLKLEKLRQQQNLPSTKLALHMSFVGNPGTGKTTVARIIADIFGALGILPKGQLVETDRSGLVAEYAGQTGPKTNAKIDEALDGVLFIDEAYTLVSSDGQDQYGREAVQTLLKRMEDARDRLIVVLAGYPLEMELMIHSNPGLSSRVGQTFDFPDYTPGEMGAIFGMMSNKSQYKLPSESRRRVLHGFNYLHARRDRHFGNGRTVRNAFEASVRRLANRLADAKEISLSLLTTLEPEDIEIPGILPSHLSALLADELAVTVHCPHCQVEQEANDSALGCELQCPSCEKSFTPLWGEPKL